MVIQPIFSGLPDMQQVIGKVQREAFNKLSNPASRCRSQLLQPMDSVTAGSHSDSESAEQSLLRLISPGLAHKRRIPEPTIASQVAEDMTGDFGGEDCAHDWEKSSLDISA
jgi:hypothetical protein